MGSVEDAWAGRGCVQVYQEHMRKSEFARGRRGTREEEALKCTIRAATGEAEIL